MTKNPSKRSPWWPISLIIEVGDDGTVNGTSSFWRYPGECWTTGYLWVIFQGWYFQCAPPDVNGKTRCLEPTQSWKVTTNYARRRIWDMTTWLRPKRAVERSLKLKNDSTSTLSLQTYRSYIMWWQKVDVFIYTYIHIGDNFLTFARNSNNLYYIDFFI